jgi:hypothetical protein
MTHPDRRIICILPALPCSILRGDAICGRDAEYGWAWQEPPKGAWPVMGLWSVQPVCKQCIAALADILGVPGGDDDE